MMGHSEDPKDGGAVAAAVFGAVAIYGVRNVHNIMCNGRYHVIERLTGSRLSSFSAPAKHGCICAKAGEAR
jgi:hypothetical protein